VFEFVHESPSKVRFAPFTRFKGEQDRGTPDAISEWRKNALVQQHVDRAADAGLARKGLYLLAPFRPGQAVSPNSI
jgi:hypothetical protein